MVPTGNGASFALNAMIEADRVVLLQGEIELVDTPSLSGKGQKIARCPECHVAVWSHYAGGGSAVCFVRVGTLDEPDHFPPDIHIFTASKQPWVVLPESTPAVAEYYKLPFTGRKRVLHDVRRCRHGSRSGQAAQNCNRRAHGVLGVGRQRVHPGCAAESRPYHCCSSLWATLPAAGTRKASLQGAMFSQSDFHASGGTSESRI